MTIAIISDKGQITLPARLRKSLGLEPRSKVDLVREGDGVLIRPVRSVRSVRGVFHDRIASGKASWEEIRAETIRRVSEEVAHEDG